MNTINCVLCGSKSKKVFEHKIMGKYTAEYYQCPNCALVFVDNPYWLEEAYASAIAMTDTGIIVRNINNIVIVKDLLNHWYSFASTILDYGGGCGIFVRMLRDVGYNAFWFDKYADPILCRGFEWNGDHVDVLCCFEVFEHYNNPCISISDLMNISSDFIVSTELYDDGFNVKSKDWWYYQFDSGQHISFYSKLTMDYIAKKYNLNYYNICGLHWFTPKEISSFKVKLFNIFHKLSFFKKKWIKNLSFSNCIDDMVKLSETNHKFDL